MKQDFYSKVKHIDTVLSSDQINPELAKSIMLLISGDESLSNYFFKRVKSIQWFDILEREKYFSVNNISFDDNGNAYFWIVLNYLERVSEQLSQWPQYGRKLIEIIESMVEYSLNKRKINHYHFWWYCVKILNNLPAAIIKDNLSITKFQTWLSVWTDHSLGSDLTISDIGEKLLPKFLHEDFAPSYIFAETIINVITVIKAGGKPNAFTKRDDAILAWQSYWILDAFKKHGQLIGQKCSLDMLFGLSDRLRRALEYKQKDHYVDLGVGSEVYRIKVARIFADGLKSGEIKFKDNQYECFIKQFTQVQLEGIDRENDFWALHNLEPQDERKCFSFTASKKDSFVAEIKENLPGSIHWQSVEDLEKKLLNIHEGLFSDYSHIWCRTLKRGPEHGGDAEDVLTVILRDVLLAKCEASREQGRQVLSVFLNDKYQFPIFRRFVLLCIDKFWADYCGFLEKLIEVVPSVLEESDLEVEIQDVLQHHNSTFSGGLKTILKKLIDNVPEYYLKKEDGELVAYWKYKWLSPLRENPDFSALYEEEKQKAKPKDGEPYEPERSSLKGGFISHKSPLSKEDILQKPIPEIVKYLSEFKGADFWNGTFEGEPDKEGFSDVLRAAVKDEPKKFSDGLDTFLNMDYFYLQSILRGLKEAWNSGKELDWNNVFDFCLKYFGRGKDAILKDALQAQGEDSGEGRYIWIVESIVELIGDRSKDDSKIFPVENFDKVEQIFDLILPLLKGEKRPDTQRDALTYALNTTLGRTIMAYVSFSLRVARATQKKKENWGRDKFERFLPIGIDGHIWFGCYLPQMKYLDNDYTVEKINFFSQKDSSDFEWQMFMDGYLTGARIYQDLYGLMRQNYIKAIENTVFKGRADERLVEHICIGYLQLGELLAQNNANGQPSLFWKMLNEANAVDKRNRWEEVAGFFWSISGRTLKKEEKEDKEEPSEDFKKKVLFFWEWTVKEQELVKSKLGEEYNAFLGRMAELTIWLDKIDENAEKWLMLCAPFIELEHRSAFFIEYLTKFDDEESIRRIGNILLKVIESTIPTFREEEIQLLVKRLFELGKKYPEVKETANNICNAYGRSGVHFLKDIWAEYNQ